MNIKPIIIGITNSFNHQETVKVGITAELINNNRIKAALSADQSIRCLHLTNNERLLTPKSSGKPLLFTWSRGLQVSRRCHEAKRATTLGGLSVLRRSSQAGPRIHKLPIWADSMTKLWTR